jgi:hypothetical protein
VYRKTQVLQSTYLIPLKKLSGTKEETLEEEEAEDG